MKPTSESMPDWGAMGSLETAQYCVEITVVAGSMDTAKLRVWVVDDNLRTHPVDWESTRRTYLDAGDAATGLRHLLRDLEKDRAAARMAATPIKPKTP